MFDLTPVGWFHTLTSLVALGAAVVAYARDFEVKPNLLPGRVYIAATAVTALTALLIFRHGGFGPGHGLAILALAALLAGYVVGRGAVAASWRHVAAALCYTFTLLCHLLPGATETLTRIPMGKPFAESPQSPQLQPVFLALFVATATLAAFQVAALRRRRVQA